MPCKQIVYENDVIQTITMNQSKSCCRILKECSCKSEIVERKYINKENW